MRAALVCLLAVVAAYRPLGYRTRSMRSRALVGCAEEESTSPLQSLFTTNRNTPAALKKQKEWARAQMESEVPTETVDGQRIEDREDFIRQYIDSEKDKFGRELSWTEAEAEVDAWLLKQATDASSKTSSTDLGLGVLVFVAAFGAGLFLANQAPPT